MHTTRLGTFTALILLTASAAQAGSFNIGGIRVNWNDSGSWNSCGYDGRGCGRPTHRPGRVCYNIAGKPYLTTLPRCPIS